jgi:hypothetical protein
MRSGGAQGCAFARWTVQRSCGRRPGFRACLVTADFSKAGLQLIAVCGQLIDGSNAEAMYFCPAAVR